MRPIALFALAAATMMLPGSALPQTDHTNASWTANAVNTIGGSLLGSDGRPHLTLGGAVKIYNFFFGADLSNSLMSATGLDAPMAPVGSVRRGPFRISIVFSNGPFLNQLIGEVWSRNPALGHLTLVGVSATFLLANNRNYLSLRAEWKL